MNPDTMMDGIFKEINATLKLMGKAKTPEDKLIYSKTIKNLCESVSDVIAVVSATMPEFLDEDFDDDLTIPF